MKKLLLLTAVITLFTAFTADINSPQGKVKLGVGTNIVYAVNFMGQQYDFNLTVTSREKGVAFDYTLTDERKTSGSVNISQEAMATAHRQNNYFAGGAMQLKQATTLWISDKVYKELKEGKTTIDLGNGAEELVLIEKMKMNVTIGGKTKSVKVLYAKTEIDNKFWIMDDKVDHLILKMEIGWIMKIKEIN